MRTVADLASMIHWRGAAARFLSNVLPVLGFALIVVGAFHLPGVWGSVGGWVAAGAATLLVHSMAAQDIEEMKTRAKADQLDRERERAIARNERRMRIAG